MTTKNFTHLALLLLFCVVSAPAIRTQTNDHTRNSGKSAVVGRNDSAQQERSSTEPPRDGEEWFARAYKFHGSDRYPEAIEAFKRAADLGYRKATAMYNIACGYALLNDKDNALIWLQRALDNGFDGRDNLRSDSDLDPLRTDPRFKKLMASVPLGDLYVREEKGYGKRDRLAQANYEYAQLESEGSQIGEHWARVGARMVMLRDFERALIALNKAISLLGDQDAYTAMYNLACAYSLKGDREAGINWLEKSVKAGFDGPEKLKYDPDLNNVRSDSRFASIEKLSNTLSLSQFYRRHDAEEFKNSEHTNYSKERWAPAVQLYESFVKNEPNIGRGWYNLGLALHYSSEFTKAISAFERALALGYHKATSIYNIACGYSMLNQRDAAFEWLDRAIKAGFDSKGDFNGDRDLDNLRSDPRFKKFRDAANDNARMRKASAQSSELPPTPRRIYEW